MLSERALAICQTHWNPPKTRCVGCPIEPECSTWSPTEPDAIAAHTAKVNEAAEACEVPR